MHVCGCRLILLLLASQFLYLRGVAQPPVFRIQSYVETYSLQAVQQMVEYKIPASVAMAQAIFESRSGSSELARRSNNHFGIKCHIEWGGDTIVKDDDTLNECFRRYSSVSESWTDHSLFLNSRARYAGLFELPAGDYVGWCTGLKAAGYATYPNYAEELIRLIEQAKLYELDGYEPLNRLDYEHFLPKTLIREPDLIAADLPIRDFADCGILWLDECDMIVQSLGFIVEAVEDDEEAPEADPIK